MHTNTLLNNSIDMAPTEREALAYRSLTAQVTDLKAALAAIGRPAELALLISNLEHDVEVFRHQEVLARHWHWLDDRVSSIDGEIKNLEKK